MAASIDWLKIKNEYINSNTTYRALADKYKVSLRQIANKAKAEGWQELKAAQCNAVAIRVQQEATNILVAKEVKRMECINDLSYQLAIKLKQAIEQLDQVVVPNKTKSTTVVYGKDKCPISEVTVEQVQPVVKDTCGFIDKRGLKQLTAALKDIHSIMEPQSSQGDGESDKLASILEQLK